MEAKYDFERKFREQILQCSRCGFCQAVCPVYGSTLRPAYNARGKMLLLKEVMDGRIDLGGTLTGEHGIGLSKAPYMTLEHDTVAMDVMRGIKRMFDPNNILNPGKMGLEIEQ